MSAQRIKKKKPSRFNWNNPQAARVATMLDGTPEMAKQFEIVRAGAKQCTLCGAPPDQLGIFTLSDEGHQTLSSVWCGVALCQACFENPDSKVRLEKRLEFELCIGKQGERVQ